MGKKKGSGAGTYLLLALSGVAWSAFVPMTSRTVLARLALRS